MSHALLLRLFLSPSFFSVHVALRYLMVYSDNIGITYYLTRRLSEFTIDELRDVWGFICHLLVSRPSKSRALECFVTDIARKSTHVAILTLWFMQASLKDFSASPQSPEALICQRILLMCHELIFGDIPPPETSLYPSLTPVHRPRFMRKKVKKHTLPALVGIGMVLVASGSPALSEVTGRVAVEQGRADSQGRDLRSLQREDDDAPHSAIPSAQMPVEDYGDDEDDSDLEEEQPAAGRHTRDSSWDGRRNGRPGATPRSPRRRTLIGPSRTTPSLPLHLQKPRKPRFSDDPLGQLDQPISARSAIQSTPSLPSSKPVRRSRGSNSMNEVDLLLARYDPDSQRELLRGHFCRSEIQFILSLENICNRLLVVPKLARVSALRAELTGLNHILPAEVCIPLWCTSTDAPNNSGSHHRIVRIPPGECVVLNSAEHAPYLLVVEILHDDLDFDPLKRQNKAVLQKIVEKENAKKGASRDLIPFTVSSTSRTRSVPTDTSDAAFEGTIPGIVVPDASKVDSPPSGPSSSALPGSNNEEEEIDLVEQLYGSEESLRARSFDLSDSIVLPPVPKNKELDLAAWSRASSSPSTPAIEQSSMNGASALSSVERSPSSRSEACSSQLGQGTGGLSLEDYSERMRTAAVMLAQLNANLVWEPTHTPSRHEQTSGGNGPLGWLQNSKWFAITPPPPLSMAEGGSHAPMPSLPSDVSSASPSMRMKLQPSEAAAIRDRIMNEMLALEEERMEHMRENREETYVQLGPVATNTLEDEGIIRRELNKLDPSAVVFSESWSAKKSRVRQGSPYGHLANWDCVSVIVKTGGDLRQEQLAVQLILEFSRIWKEENCQCWARPFSILITGGSSGLVETITDAVSIHSIKKAEYARRLTTGRLGHVSLLDHFKNTYGDPSSAKYARAQRNFAKSLAGYSVITYLLQIKDRHNGNILLDREGHLIHIDFGFMLSNSPGNMGFEAAPFKLPLEYVEVLGGVDSEPLREFRRLFREGFEAARKHCDRLVTMVDLMQKDSTLPCFAAFGAQTATLFRERFQQALTQSLVEEHVDRLIDTSLGSHWTRLYDSYQYYSQSIL
ncbi:kinase-like domain-containing protein [Amylostereum chailletii]|nr:kinase-like domain-containing protein [Amylostereum chailletii]